MSEKLATLIEKEEKNLKKYKEKKAEYDEKIKKSEAKLKEYRILQNNAKYNDLSDAVQKKGLSLEDILLAVQTGDLLVLQEQMETIQKEKMNENQTAQQEQESMETYDKNNDSMNGDEME